MDEFALREMVADVKRGRLSRRRFVQTMIGLGLTGPMAARMLAAGGVAEAQPKSPVFAPRGAAGAASSSSCTGRRPPSSTRISRPA